MDEAELPSTPLQAQPKEKKNPPLLSFSVRGRQKGDESVGRVEGKQGEERKNKRFGPSGRPVWWLLLAHVWSAGSFSRLAHSHSEEVTVYKEP